LAASTERGYERVGPCRRTNCILMKRPTRNLTRAQGPLTKESEKLVVKVFKTKVPLFKQAD